MIAVKNDSKITLKWGVMKGASGIFENFSRAILKVFLVSSNDKRILSYTITDGKLVMVVPTGLPNGVYGVEAIWVKNPTRMIAPNPTGQGLCRSRIDNVFSITSNSNEITNSGDITLNLKSQVATYGYDGLNAYEMCVLYGKWGSSQSEFLTSKLGQMLTTDEIANGAITWNKLASALQTIVNSKAEKSYVDTELAKKISKADYKVLQFGGYVNNVTIENTSTGTVAVSDIKYDKTRKCFVALKDNKYYASWSSPSSSDYNVYDSGWKTACNAFINIYNSDNPQIVMFGGYVNNVTIESYSSPFPLTPDAKDIFWDTTLNKFVVKVVAGTAPMQTTHYYDDWATKSLYHNTDGSLTNNIYVDISTKDLSNKVDKVDGKGLIDTAITNVLRSVDGGETLEVSADLTANDIYASGEITDKNNNKLSKKVDKVEGKSLIDSDVADAFVENAEYGYQFDDGLKINGELEAQDSEHGAHNVGNELKKLMNKAFPFTASASIDITLAKVGDSQRVTISNIKGEVEGVAQSVDIYIKEPDSEYIKLSAGSNSHSFSNVTKTTTYTIKVVSKTDGREAVITKTITFVYPTYYGFGASYSDVAVSGNAQTWTSAKRTYALSNGKTTACKFYLIVPTSGVSVPSSFTMGGAPYVMNRTTQTINNTSYYVFESGGTYATGGSVNIVAS